MKNNHLSLAHHHDQLWIMCQLCKKQNKTKISMKREKSMYSDNKQLSALFLSLSLPLFLSLCDPNSRNKLPLSFLFPFLFLCAYLITTLINGK